MPSSAWRGGCLLLPDLDLALGLIAGGGGGGGGPSSASRGGCILLPDLDLALGPIAGGGGGGGREEGCGGAAGAGAGAGAGGRRGARRWAQWREAGAKARVWPAGRQGGGGRRRRGRREQCGARRGERCPATPPSAGPKAVAGQGEGGQGSRPGYCRGLTPSRRNTGRSRRSTGESASRRNARLSLVTMRLQFMQWWQRSPARQFSMP